MKWLIAVIFKLLVLVLSTFVPNLSTAATYQAEGEGVKVVVYDTPCALKEVVNLTQGATWTEKEKTTEGCAGVHPGGFVIFYFADKTVVIISTSNFVKVTGA